MKTTVTRFIPFLIHEFEQMESWLCHMALRGFFLESAFWLWGTFEKGSPRNRKYRVIPKAFGSAGTEEKEIYAASGWHYVCAKGDFTEAPAEKNSVTTCPIKIPHCATGWSFSLS